jgi:hypothetical protein
MDVLVLAFSGQDTVGIGSSDADGYYVMPIVSVTAYDIEFSKKVIRPPSPTSW